MRLLVARQPALLHLTNAQQKTPAQFAKSRKPREILKVGGWPWSDRDAADSWWGARTGHPWHASRPPASVDIQTPVRGLVETLPPPTEAGRRVAGGSAAVRGTARQRRCSSQQQRSCRRTSAERRRSWRQAPSSPRAPGCFLMLLHETCFFQPCCTAPQGGALIRFCCAVHPAGSRERPGPPRPPERA
jgi:hypothetical protein